MIDHKLLDIPTWNLRIIQVADTEFCQSNKIIQNYDDLFLLSFFFADDTSRKYRSDSYFV